MKGKTVISLKMWSILMIACLALSCAGLKEVRDRFDPNMDSENNTDAKGTKPSDSNIEDPLFASNNSNRSNPKASRDSSCLKVNQASPVRAMSLCLRDDSVVFVRNGQLTQWPLEIWKSYLAHQLKKSLKEIDLEADKYTSINVYFASSGYAQSNMSIFADVESDKWIVRFKTAVNPNDWPETMHFSFFVDKSLKKKVPFTGRFMLQYKSVKDAEKMVDVVRVFPSIEVKKQALTTWEISLNPSKWRIFAREFLMSPFISNKIVSWNAIPYSEEVGNKRKVLTFDF